jgi:hypothetical protein
VEWNGVAPTGQEFEVCLYNDAGTKVGECQSLADTECYTWEGLVPGAYTVEETDLGDAAWIQPQPIDKTVIPGEECAYTEVKNIIQPPGCFVTGIGHIDVVGGKTKAATTRASFGGNAKTFVKDGLVDGEWQHIDHVTKDQFHGDVTYLSCDHADGLNGPQVPDAYPLNRAYFGGDGTGIFNKRTGCDFDIIAYDIGEGGSHQDSYEITVTCGTPPVVVLHNIATTDQCKLGVPGIPTSIGCLAGGNFQIHPSNAGHPYTAPV